MDLVSRRARVAALVIACAPAVALGQDASPAPMTPAERAYRASRVYGAALSYFAHWADAPDEAAIEAAHRAYVEAALSGEGRAAFTRASMRFLATFRNGHTLFFDKVLVGNIYLTLYGRASQLDSDGEITVDTPVEGSQTGVRQDRIREAGAELGYQFRTRVRMGLTLTYTTRTSSFDVFGIEGLLAGFTLQYNPPQPSFR